MGLFSRGLGKDKDANSTSPAEATGPVAAEAAPAAEPAPPSRPAPESYLAQRPQAPEVPLAADVTAAPGHPLVDNTEVAEALQRMAEDPSAHSFYDIMRRCATGELLFDITASTLNLDGGSIQAGSTLALRTHQVDDGREFLLVFTSNAEIIKANPPGTEIASLAQPALDSLRMGADKPYDGVIFNAAAGPASCIVEAAEIWRGLPAVPGSNEGFKTLLAAPRDEEWSNAALAAFVNAPVVYIPMDHHTTDTGEDAGVSVPGARGPDGRAFAVAFTSPAEAWAWSEGSEAYPTGASNVISVTLDNPDQAGIIINPMGPSLIIPRELLAVIAPGAPGATDTTA
ncbi:SseB family protein [Glaciihabitans sp. dw_435]|uniref:SseB family protein n=1 Tax=Glaciihabitans sp. dw_435 TaxID=2720081 RepID=UPI001BD4076B|nr:SseB family protein [Glaciihabitans sp. dw_435]